MPPFSDHYSWASFLQTISVCCIMPIRNRSQPEGRTQNRLSRTLDGADDGRGGNVPKQVHRDDLVRLPGRSLGHGHRPHAHSICAVAEPSILQKTIMGVECSDRYTSIMVSALQQTWHSKGLGLRVQRAEGITEGHCAIKTLRKAAAQTPTHSGARFVQAQINTTNHPSLN
jgi:hypothetical protein